MLKIPAIAALVFISCFGSARADEAKSSGTGFAVTSDGWILTNAHVVDGCERVDVKGVGTVFSSRVDAVNDLALIRVAPTKPLAPLTFRRAPIRLGEDIVAIGYPLAGLLSDSIKITTGNVNALAGPQNDTRYIQISTPIQPGNSGGPVVDKDGLLIGITSATLSKQVADAIGITAQNVNFAIRASVAELFLQSQSVTGTSGDRVADQPPLPTADLADKLSPSVYYIQCFGKLEAGAPAEVTDVGQRNAPQQTLAPVMLEMGGYDAIGFDYINLPDISYLGCKAACESDGQCKALTYNTKYGVCFLKYDVVALIRNTDAIAAYTSSKSKDVIVSGFTSYSDVDLPGGDYKRLQKIDYIQCLVNCLEENACKAFSYVRKKHECWLKNRLGSPKRIKGVELGVK